MAFVHGSFLCCGGNANYEHILIACGGTGGHLAPGIAIAEVLQQRGHACTLLISQKQVDSALIEKYKHLNFVKTPGQAFAGGLSKWISSVWSLLSSLRFSHKLVRGAQPDLVLLFGGFLSVGLGLAARFAGLLVAGFLVVVFFRDSVANVTCSLGPKRPTSLARLR